MDIARAGKVDVKEIIRLQRACYRENAERYDDESIPPLRETEEDLLAAFDDLIVLVAVREGEIVGSVRAFLKESTCHIGRLMVDPGHQNHGIGRRLMGEIETSFPQARRFELFTGWKDDKNLSLYGKLGFVSFKEEEPHEGMRFIFLEKHRTPSPEAS